MTLSAPTLLTGPDGRGRHRLLDRWAAGVAVLSALAVAAGVALGWRGVDLPAQLYRVQLFQQHGFTLWDSQWFGGHWLLDYSVLFPAVAASVGVAAVAVTSAGVATAAFDRLVVGHFGRRGRAASVVFAVGLTVQSSIGQLTYLLGEAAALWCVVLVVRRRPWMAAAAAALAALSSPLAGAFAALAVVAPLVADVVDTRGRHLRADVVANRRGLGVVAAVGVPVAVTSVLFPGQGAMPFPVLDVAWEMAVAGALWSLTPRTDRVLRAGTGLYALAIAAAAVVPTPLGGNIGRLEDSVALPVAVALLWSRRTVGDTPAAAVVVWLSTARLPVLAWIGSRARRMAGPRRCGALLAALGVPLVLSQWTPAWAAMTTNQTQAYTHEAYYRPVVAYLRSRPGPAGRVEVVPTSDHWEAAYVAPAVALARGWERQLDLADNALFYGPTPLDAVEYRAWLLDNGVRYVALPDGPLDQAGMEEGQLLTAGVVGLVPVWHKGGWRVWQVTASTGIVGRGGELVSMDGSHLLVHLDGPGSVDVRVRYSPAWQVLSGPGTVGTATGAWVQLTSPTGGDVELTLRPLG